MTAVNLVSPEYFAILRIPLREGRIWNGTENQKGAHITVINRTFAQRYFPNGSAIGSSVKLPKLEDSPPTILSAPEIADSWLHIVGVVDDVKEGSLDSEVWPAEYDPINQNADNYISLVVRTTQDEKLILPALVGATVPLKSAPVW